MDLQSQLKLTDIISEEMKVLKKKFSQMRDDLEQAENEKNTYKKQATELNQKHGFLLKDVNTLKS